MASRRRRGTDAFCTQSALAASHVLRERLGGRLDLRERRGLADRLQIEDPRLEAIGAVGAHDGVAGHARLPRARRDLPRDAAGSHLAAWERDARDAFLAAYRDETADQGATFLPADPAAFAAALAAWELDKAIYEVDYELNNRPD